MYDVTMRRSWVKGPRALCTISAISYEFIGLAHWLSGKESACNTGDEGLIPGWGRSLEGRHSNPLQYSCLENPHGQRSLAGYSP